MGLTPRGSQVRNLSRPLCGVLVKLVITPACHAGGHGFESRTPRQSSSRGFQRLAGIPDCLATPSPECLHRCLRVFRGSSLSLAKISVVTLDVGRQPSEPA